MPVKFGTLGIGVSMLSMGTMDKYDNTGARVGNETFTASDRAITLSYAKALKAGSMPLNVGINLKSISSAIDSVSASAIGADIGAQLKVKGEKMKVGLAVQNIGSGMKFALPVATDSAADPLPMNIKAGTAYRVDLNKNSDLLIGLDINMPSDNDTRINFGTEYALRVGKEFGLAGRAGYRSNTKGLTGLAGFTFGVGFGFKSYSLDWAFVPYGELGDTNRISFAAKF